MLPPTQSSTWKTSSTSILKYFDIRSINSADGGAVPTLYPADSFGAVSDSSGKVILVNATLLSDFSDIIGNRHKNPFFQFYRYFLIVIMQNNVSDKKDLQFYRQCPVIAEASDFPRTFPNMSKRSFSLTLIGAYFSLSEIRKIPSLSFCNFLI